MSPSSGPPPPQLPTALRERWSSRAKWALWLWLGAVFVTPLGLILPIATNAEAVAIAVLWTWPVLVLASSIFVGWARAKATGNPGLGVALGFAALAVGVVVSAGWGVAACSAGLAFSQAFHA